MKYIATAIVCAAALVLGSSAASAQTVLKQLEGQLRGGPLMPSGGASIGFLGLIADDRKANGSGVRVLDCMPGGPAQAAGFKPGDLITSFGGKPIRSMSDFAAALAGAGPGTKFAAQVDRAGTPTTLEVRLGTRPTVAPPSTVTSMLPAPIAPATVSTPPANDARVAALESRVAELERRVVELEAQLKAKTNGPALSTP
ncbi:MAG TPA: PDZ domain-containing protein [Pirellulales bacterium]|jgi:membrane-associated protease RseP (regulator of RpoE activity)|nr:PDZ domain-containing protein [Pirellulales bacterium]